VVELVVVLELVVDVVEGDAVAVVVDVVWTGVVDVVDIYVVVVLVVMLVVDGVDVVSVLVVIAEVEVVGLGSAIYETN